MTDKLMAHFVQCGMVKQVWYAVKMSYLDVSDSSQVYELMKNHSIHAKEVVMFQNITTN